MSRTLSGKWPVQVC